MSHVQEEESTFNRKLEFGNHWPLVLFLDLSAGWDFKIFPMEKC